MNRPSPGPGAAESFAGDQSRPAFWWNAYAALLLATVGTVELVFLKNTVPGLAQSFHAANQALPLSLRMISASSRVAPWVVMAIGVAAVVMRWARIRFPAAMRMAAMPAVAWLVVTATLVALTLTVGQLRPAG
jgi:hypothetical protein